MAKTRNCAIGVSAAWMALLGCMVLPGTASADTQQVLDRVAGFSPTGARQMAFDVPPQERTQDSIQYFATPRSATGFVACQLTGRGGLACLDGREVRYWPNASKSPETSETLFSCEDPLLGLDTKRGVQTCSGLAVDLSGAVWVSGKKPNNSYSLIKTVPVIPPESRNVPDAACPAGATLLTGGKYCKFNDEFAAGRPLLQEITSVDGDLGAEFKYRKGVAGVELRSSIVYFTDPKDGPKVIASGKSALGLSGNEQVLSAALLRLESGTFVFLYVTNTGRVLAINDDTKTWVQVFDGSIPLDRASATPPATCPATSGDDFAIATSSKSGRVYVSDRRFCRIVALEETVADNAYRFKLVNVQEPGPSGSPRKLTLSTGSLNPDSVSVAPGIVLNLANCFGECDYVNSPEGEAAATLRFVRLQNTGKTNMTVFQITGIPDCRYIRLLDDGSVDPRCAGKEAVVNPGDHVALQKLDVTKLLPKEVTDLFAAGELPPMLITERYRGQEKNGYVFDAFFGLPEPGVEFRDVFEGEFAVDKLAGNSLGCSDPLPGTTKPFQELLQWDVTTTVSERFVTYGKGDVDHQDTIVNSGCGSTKVTGSRWSLYAYNLELNPDTVSDVGETRYLNTADDAVFAKLVDQLYDDLGAVQANQVCGIPPEGSVAPLSGSVCGTLASSWANGRDKLTKCIGASTQPKQSSGDQNCTAFRSQLTNYRSTIESIPPAVPGRDIANRIGELKARARIVEYLFVYRFLPSIPAAGFCESPGTAPNFTCGMTPIP